MHFDIPQVAQGPAPVSRASEKLHGHRHHDFRRASELKPTWYWTEEGYILTPGVSGGLQWNGAATWSLNGGVAKEVADRLRPRDLV